MLLEIFEKSFYGNTIREWFIAFLIILSSIIISRIIYWLIGRTLKKMAQKTKSRIDYIIVDIIEEPLVLTIVIIGIWYGLKILALSPDIKTFFERIFNVVVVFNVAWFINRFLNSLINEYLVPLAKKSKGDLDDQIINIIRKGLRIIIWIIAIIVALNNSGYDVGAVLAGLGLGGLAFALAAQDTLSNLFGSLTILTDKPFRSGERIVINDYDGYVIEVGLRSMRLRTLAGRIVTIPNSAVANSVVENISSEPSRKIVMNIGLTYDTDHDHMEKAMSIIREIARENDAIEDRIILYFSSFGDFSLNLEFIYYIKKSADIFETQTDINLAVLKEFNENKLEFAFPTQTIYTKQGG